MENNTVTVLTPTGGIAPAIRIDPGVRAKVERFLARNLDEFRVNRSKCVIAEHDVSQLTPIVRQLYKNSYGSFLGAILSLLTGWHFIRCRYRPLYWANSDGLRLIAKYGDPHRAYAALMT